MLNHKNCGCASETFCYCKLKIPYVSFCGVCLEQPSCSSINGSRCENIKFSLDRIQCTEWNKTVTNSLCHEIPIFNHFVLFLGLLRFWVFCGLVTVVGLILQQLAFVKHCFFLRYPAPGMGDCCHRDSSSDDAEWWDFLLFLSVVQPGWCQPGPCKVWSTRREYNTGSWRSCMGAWACNYSCVCHDTLLPEVMRQQVATNFCFEPAQLASAPDLCSMCANCACWHTKLIS